MRKMRTVYVITFNHEIVDIKGSPETAFSVFIKTATDYCRLMNWGKPNIDYNLLKGLQSNSEATYTFYGDEDDEIRLTAKRVLFMED